MCTVHISITHAAHTANQITVRKIMHNSSAFQHYYGAGVLGCDVLFFCLVQWFVLQCMLLCCQLYVHTRIIFLHKCSLFYTHCSTPPTHSTNISPAPYTLLYNRGNLRWRAAAEPQPLRQRGGGRGGAVRRRSCRRRRRGFTEVHICVCIICGVLFTLWI